jgi:hypothetical protein
MRTSRAVIGDYLRMHMSTTTIATRLAAVRRSIANQADRAQRLKDVPLCAECGGPRFPSWWGGARDADALKAGGWQPDKGSSRRTAGAKRPDPSSDRAEMANRYRIPDSW